VASGKKDVSVLLRICALLERMDYEEAILSLMKDDEPSPIDIVTKNPSSLIFLVQYHHSSPSADNKAFLELLSKAQ
jgi:hypothetical protein